MEKNKESYETVIVGAGPGGLQAAIYLARYNFGVVVLDRSGGRTRHARHVENYLGHPAISGADLLDIAEGQARSFGAEVERDTVLSVKKGQEGGFEVHARSGRVYRARTVIAASGVMDKLPRIKDMHRHFGRSFFTCIDCDGYRCTGKKLLVVGNHINTVRLAFAMKKMYTRDISLLLLMYDPPEDYREELASQGITLYKGRPERLLGQEGLEGLVLEDGTRIPCEVVMANFGFHLQDEYLSGLGLERDSKGFKYVVNRHCESSLPGLYIVGPLNTGNDQIVISAGQGAVAAVDIKKRLMEL
ncbi:MAG: NAD(P)/FAD-dependent oxidoreductase [Nitrospirota bacterium]